MYYAFNLFVGACVYCTRNLTTGYKSATLTVLLCVVDPKDGDAGKIF